MTHVVRGFHYFIQKMRNSFRILLVFGGDALDPVGVRAHEDALNLLPDVALVRLRLLDRIHSLLVVHSGMVTRTEATFLLDKHRRLTCGIVHATIYAVSLRFAVSGWPTGSYDLTKLNSYLVKGVTYHD